MSVRLHLDEDLVQVSSMPDDSDAVLLVQTKKVEIADGRVRKVSTTSGRKVQTELPRAMVRGLQETRIGVNDAKGQPEYEVRTAPARWLRFSFRWYGEGNRYLELRLRANPSVKIVTNSKVPEGGQDFLGELQSDQWAEIHYDNQGKSKVRFWIHEDRNFAKWSDVPEPPPVPRTRFDRIVGDDGVK